MSKERDKDVPEVGPVGTSVPKRPSSAKGTSVLELLKSLKGELTSEQESSVSEVLERSGNPDEDPEVLRSVIDLLEDWGFRPIDNDSGSLVIESESERKAAKINELVTQGKMPTIKYKSNVGLYGFKVEPVEGGILYIKPLDVVNKIEDRLRVSGDRGGKITDFFRKGVRRRANLQEAKVNIQELGLQAYFTDFSSGIVETTEDISKGFMLTDLLGNRDDRGFLAKFDRWNAVKEASRMVAQVHSSSKRGIGELLTNNIVFGVTENKMSNPRLTFPNITFSEDVEALEQQATDMLDFLFSVGSTRRSATGEIDFNLARMYIHAVFDGYGLGRDGRDVEMVKRAIRALSEQGRPFLTLHNGVRLGFDRVKNKKEAFERIRGLILEEV